MHFHSKDAILAISLIKLPHSQRNIRITNETSKCSSILQQQGNPVYPVKRRQVGYKHGQFVAQYSTQVGIRISHKLCQVELHLQGLSFYQIGFSKHGKLFRYQVEYQNEPIVSILLLFDYMIQVFILPMVQVTYINESK